MTNFNELFGGNTIAPAQLSYTAYTISANLVLQWPLNISLSANAVAQKIDINAAAVNLTVKLPPANQVSTGMDILFRNVAANTFSVLDNAGNVIATVASGTSWYLYLTDNTTVPGTWAVMQFGAGVSTANAGALAGAGLKAIITTLNQDLVTTPINGNYSPSASDRAAVLLETGGVSVFTPATPTSLGNGWFVYVINAGSGTLTWTPSGGALVDNAATKVINPNESAIFFSDGTNFWTLGYGRAIVSTVSGVTISVTGQASPMTLTPSQVAAQVQDYTGTLTADLKVLYGTGVGYWFVRNNTSGAFTLTLATNGGDAGVTVAQGSFSIIRSNGSNMAIAFTATSGTVTSVATGTGLTGGPITTIGTISLANTAVTPGTYGAGLNYPSITVDQQGRITAATTVALGSAAALTAGAAAGNVPVLDASGLVPAINGGWSTGDLKYSILQSVAGWVSSNGTTIGSATSGATGRANADTVNLFTALWNNMADAQAPVSGGRGVSAAADFVANKTITLPDLRGRFMAGMDILNGSANANRLSTIISSTTLGAAGGAQTETASVSVSGNVSVSGSTSGTLSGSNINNLPTIDITSGPGSATQSIFAGQILVNVSGTLSGSMNGGNTLTGATAAATNVPPAMVFNVFIKL